MKYDWTDWTPTEPLLVQSDRFTRAAIQRDFEADPDRGALAVEGGLLATPVANERYTVIWRREGAGAQVKAVVASQLRNGSPQALRRKLESVLEAQSQGMITLE